MDRALTTGESVRQACICGRSFLSGAPAFCHPAQRAPGRSAVFGLSYPLRDDGDRVVAITSSAVGIAAQVLASCNRRSRVWRTRRVAARLQQSLEARVTQRTAELGIAQSRAHELAETYQFMLSSAKIGAWDLDRANDAARRSFRYDRCFGYQEPIADWGFEEFIAHVYLKDRADVQRQFGQALTGVREWHFESRVIWPDASVHWIEAHGTVYNNVMGPQRMVGIVADITERKDAEAALRQADTRKNEFLATLAPELRNPLAPVASVASMLGLGRPLDQQRPTLAGQTIARQIKHMAGLIEGLLDVSRVTRSMVALSSVSLDFRTGVGTRGRTGATAVRSKNGPVRGVGADGAAADHGRCRALGPGVFQAARQCCQIPPEGGRIIASALLREGSLDVAIIDNDIGIGSDFLPRVFELLRKASAAPMRSAALKSG